MKIGLIGPEIMPINITAKMNRFPTTVNWCIGLYSPHFQVYTWLFFCVFTSHVPTIYARVCLVLARFTLNYKVVYLWDKQAFTHIMSIFPDYISGYADILHASMQLLQWFSVISNHLQKTKSHIYMDLKCEIMTNTLE